MPQRQLADVFRSTQIRRPNVQVQHVSPKAARSNFPPPPGKPLDETIRTLSYLTGVRLASVNVGFGRVVHAALRTSVTIACASADLPSPTGPTFSAVLNFTDVRSKVRLRAAARLSRIARR